jgi:hypothetical protein
MDRQQYRIYKGSCCVKGKNQIKNKTKENKHSSLRILGSGSYQLISLVLLLLQDRKENSDCSVRRCQSHEYESRLEKQMKRPISNKRIGYK